MPRGKRSSRRAYGAVLLGALLVTGLAGCSLLPAAAEGGGAAPVGGDTAAAGSADVRAVSPASGSVKGGTTVTLTGTGLDDVRAVTVAGTTVPARTKDGAVVFTSPSAARFAAGTDRVTLRTASGAAVGSTTYRYRVVDGVDRELAYVLKYWQHYNPAYEPLGDDDCVDFTSQALLQRGWTQQDDWVHADDVFDSGAAWRSSTAFRDFMEEHPALGTPLTDQQRSQVKLGDVVQFDWDRSGDRDHTGVVTRIVKSKDGHIEIDFAGHTNDSDYRSVDTAITKDHPGGAVYYWSLK
ncbi:MAG: amidase domain-containing protein [Amnibacterium sp.]